MARQAGKYRYLLSFGSNLGDRLANGQRAVASLARYVHFRRTSAWIHTAPLNSQRYSTTDHREYLNFIAEVSSDLQPARLYSIIQEIEDAIGHERSRKWLPRHMDIDLLFWAKNDHEEFHQCTPLKFSDPSGLTVPHPEFWHRPFLIDLATRDLGLALAHSP